MSNSHHGYPRHAPDGTRPAEAISVSAIEHRSKDDKSENDMPSGPEGPTPIWGQRMVGQGRLELPTSRLSSARSNQLSYWPVSRIRLASSRGVPGNGGGGRVRTDDLRLAKPPLSQLRSEEHTSELQSLMRTSYA